MSNEITGLGLDVTCTAAGRVVNWMPSKKPKPYTVAYQGGGRIRVSYKENGATVSFSGEDSGNGHYRLRLDDPNYQGQATLHQAPDSKILEGYWEEEADGDHGEKVMYTGFWRIELSEPPSGDAAA